MTGVPVVIDNSVVMRWFHPMGTESDLASADSALSAIGTGQIMPTVPVIFLMEFPNVLRELHRRNALKGSAESALLHWERLDFVVKGHIHGNAMYMRELHTLSFAHAITAYDAAYLELALRLQCPLITLDKKLRKSAVKSGIAVSLT